MAGPLPSSTCLRAARTISRQTSSCSHDSQARIQSQCFSTSAPMWPRGVKGTNKLRGLSVVHARGNIYKRVRSIRPHELPVPVMDPAFRNQPRTDLDHGLWGFFSKDKEPITEPKLLGEHGRSWTKKELRIKDWTDMHMIWWKCHLLLNKLATEKAERKRLEPGYGDYELKKQVDALKGTQRAIRETLTERYEAWQEARYILNNNKDPDLKIGDDGNPVRREQSSYGDPYESDEIEAPEGEAKIEPMERVSRERN